MIAVATVEKDAEGFHAPPVRTGSVRHIRSDAATRSSSLHRRGYLRSPCPNNTAAPACATRLTRDGDLMGESFIRLASSSHIGS